MLLDVTTAPCAFRQFAAAADAAASRLPFHAAFALPRCRCHYADYDYATPCRCAALLPAFRDTLRRYCLPVMARAHYAARDAADAPAPLPLIRCFDAD
jgi:hypothetical protein